MKRPTHKDGCYMFNFIGNRTMKTTRWTVN